MVTRNKWTFILLLISGLTLVVLSSLALRSAYAQVASPQEQSAHPGQAEINKEPYVCKTPARCARISQYKTYPSVEVPFAGDGESRGADFQAVFPVSYDPQSSNLSTPPTICPFHSLVGTDICRVTGEWTLFYDWGCDGGVGSTTITFYDNFTFVSGSGSGGTWTLSGDEIIWTYSNGTEYTGTIDGPTMEGTMVSYTGTPGCWWAERTTAVEMGPSQRRPGAPGQIVSFTHLVTNTTSITSTTTATAVIAFEAGGPPGWTLSSRPPTLTLAPGTVSSVTIDVTPSGVLSGTAKPVWITATVGSGPAHCVATVTDWVTVTQGAGVQLEPYHTTDSPVGITQIYRHTLTNVGSYTDTYTLTLRSARGWDWQLDAEPLSLGVAESQEIALRTFIPITVPEGTVEIITLTVTSTLDSAHSAMVVDVTRIITCQSGVPDLFFRIWDDVESGNQNWITQKPWAITAEDAHSGSRSWSDSPGGLYNNNTDTSLTSESLDLTEIANTKLAFWHRYDFEPCYDGGLVEYSIDGGKTWIQAIGYRGTLDTFAPVVGALPMLDGCPDARIRLRVVSNDNLTGDGWHIDDIQLFGESLTCSSYVMVDLDSGHKRVGTASKVITFSHTVSNTSLYTTTVHFSVMTYHGWPVEYLPTLKLGDGAQRTFVLSVTVPSGVLSGTAETIRTIAFANPGRYTIVDDTLVAHAAPQLGATKHVEPPIVTSHSGQSLHTLDDLDDAFTYPGTRFRRIYFYAHSDDDDTLDAIVTAYNTSNGTWDTLYSDTGGSRLLLDQTYAPIYSYVRIQLDDTDNNDDVYYEYAFDLARGVKKGDTLTYTLSLANWGRAKAMGIVVTDTLSPHLSWGGYVSVTTGTPVWVAEEHQLLWHGTAEFSPPSGYGPVMNMAHNPTRMSHPNPLESDPGQGSTDNLWEIVDGQRNYFLGQRGLAFTGGKCDPACGWRQATIDFGEPQTFDRVVVWHHGLEHVPTTYKIQYWNEQNWVDVFSTTNGYDYLLYPTDFATEWWEKFSTPTENTFDPVTSSKVRFTLDNCDITHGWIYEFEVYRASPEQAVRITYNATVNADLAEGTPITNTAQIVGQGIDLFSTNVVTTYFTTPGLHIAKSGSHSQAMPGETINYTLTVNNSDSIESNGIVITDRVPLSTTYISGGTLAGDVVSWALATLPPGTGESVNLKVRVDDVAISGTQIINGDYGATVSRGAIVSHGGLVSVTVVTPPPLPAAAFPFHDGFESAALDKGWATGWTQEGRVRVSTGYPYQGGHSVLLDDSVDNGTYSSATLILTIDLSEQPEAKLDFWWRKFDDRGDTEGGIFISDDSGFSWHQVVNLENSGSWHHEIVDLDLEATNYGITFNNHFQIKFQFYGSGPIDVSGYAIDDVRITEPANVQIGLSHSGHSAPGHVISFTHPVTNAANFTDGVVFEAVGPLGWLVSLNPVTTTLSAGAVSQVTLDVIPAGVLSGTVKPVWITATAASDPASYAETTDYVTIGYGAGGGFSRAQSRRTHPEEALTITHVLTNTGSYTDTFALTHNSAQGWTWVLTPLSITLGAGETHLVTASTTVSPTIAVGTEEALQLTATSQADLQQQAVVTDSISYVAGVVLSEAQNLRTHPGEALTIAHILTNTGSYTDTFALTHDSAQGWTWVLTPLSITLGTGETHLVTVSTTIPLAITAGIVEALRLTAMSQAAPQQQATVTNTISYVAGAAFSGAQSLLTYPGKMLTVIHVLTNTGSYTDVLTLAFASSQEWVGEVSPSRVTLGAAEAQSVTLSVTTPAMMHAGTTQTLHLTATSQADPQQQAVVTDTVWRPECGGETTYVIFQDDVEGGSRDWTAGAPWAITTQSAHSGGRSWSDSPGGNYGNDTDAALILGPLDLTEVVSTTLVFWHRYTFESCCDRGYVEYSTDGGMTWNRAASYHGTLDSFTGVTLTLAALDGQSNALVRFRTLSDSSVTYDGWHVDDIRLLGTSPVCEFFAMVDLDSGQEHRGMVGETVTYTHMISNVSPYTGMLRLDVTTYHSWAVEFPSEISLGGGEQRYITFTVKVPGNVPSGTVETILITATVAGNLGQQDTAVDTLVVDRRASFALYGPHSLAAYVGKVLNITYSIINTGNYSDTFDLALYSSQGWDWALDAYSVTLGIYQTQDIPLKITTPYLVGETVETLRLTATSRADPLQQAEIATTIWISNCGMIYTFFQDSVESGHQGWLADPPWAITTEKANSGDHSWSDSPDGNYDNNADTALTLGPLDLTDLISTTLFFWHRYDFQPHFDHGYVEYSTDGGASWTEAASYHGRFNMFFMPAVLHLPALDRQPNAYIRFRIVSDYMQFRDGWYIDDIKLLGRLPCPDWDAPRTTARLNPPLPQGNEGWYLTPVILTLTAEDDQSEVDYSAYRVNNDYWQTYTAPTVITEQGRITITYYSMDLAGNKEKNQTSKFKADSTAPSSIASVPPSCTSSPILVAWNTTDTSSGAALTRLWYRLSQDQTWSDSNLPPQSGDNGVFSFEPGQGENTYCFATQAIDIAGNQEPMPNILVDSCCRHRLVNYAYLPLVLRNH